MANRFNSGAAPTQNNNNYMTDRSSTRSCKPPGGGSTMGSLIYGSSDTDTASSFMDERKTRRYKSQTPEHNPIVDKDSFYGTSTSAQRDRERVTVAPGAVSRDALVQQQQQATALARRANSNTSSSASAEYFAGGMGAHEADNNQRRTKRMYGPPGGASSFKLG